MHRLGLGMGWRPEIARTVEELDGVDWVEVVAENICPSHLPPSLVRLRGRGVTVVPHGVSLGLGGAERPDPARLAALSACAQALGSPLVTEHIAFVSAGGGRPGAPRLEAGHLLPVPRTRTALDVLCENVHIAQEALPVPLALENIAGLFSWPDEDFTEAEFLTELVERTGVRLLIDVANLHTNHVNRGEDPAKTLAALPRDALAYVHVAGGVLEDGVWHDSHAHPVPSAVLDVLAGLCARMTPPGVLLERDESFPPADELAAELASIRRVVADGRPSREVPEGAGPSVEPRHRPVAADGREALAHQQEGLLSALVAGGPVPVGFDAERVRLQARLLTVKRCKVVAKVTPELPALLGDRYRPLYLAYARRTPLTGGHRRDSLRFAEHLLLDGTLLGPPERARLSEWWLRQAGGSRPRPGALARLTRACRRILRRK
ncbi:DUF692 domain-containing protein [Streptomyces sp. MUM 203J]|uniref:DUF692 domain-containing protein n=1 Tax=Streptomyces sp. MUM 203J TaxID=2791990 RepID=UPI001F04E871|nr:DUF692 domain-containing protein [Streptomyces sp. MUM 203J]MCH0541592.1 DUF692 domain-containing protein [Streptomyces sp. MUM 203J]